MTNSTDQATRDARDWNKAIDESDEAMTRHEIEEYRADLILSQRRDNDPNW